MDDYAKAIDVKEMGKRFKLVRQKLGMTQTKIAEELGTSQFAKIAKISHFSL